MDIVQLTSKMQQIVQHWEQLLYTSRGALALEKCFFVALELQLLNNEHTLSTPTAISTSMSLTSGNNYTKCVPILQSSTSKGKRNLGASLAPDGNIKADLEILYSKGRSMSMYIVVSQLKQHKIAIAYKMMLYPAMKYTLRSTTLTIQDCAKVDRSYLSTLFSQMGIIHFTRSASWVKMSCTLIFIVVLFKLIKDSMKPFTLSHFIHLIHSFCWTLDIIQ